MPFTLDLAENRRRLTARLGLIATLCLASVTAAAQPSERPAPPPAPAAQQPVTVVDPYTLEDLGITVLLPENTVVDTQFVPGGKTKAVLKAADNTWVIQIFNANSSNTNLTVEEILDNFEQQRRAGLEAYTRSNPGMFRNADPRFFTDDEHGRSPLVVSGRIDPPNLVISGEPAGRFYCDTPLMNPNIATGYTVFRQGPGRFVIFQLDCMDETFAQSQRVYETVVASVTFENADEQNADRATALLAGKSFLAGISNEDIEAVLSDEIQHYRLYKPAPTGLASDATEIGWQRVQMRLGQRGELEAGHTRDRWTAADREYGYLVKVEGKITQRKAVYDIRAVYFLDRQRTNEAISILNTQRVNNEVAWTSTTTVIRRGPMMTLSTTQTGSPSETRDWSVPDEYISRVELELLPRLVALKNPDDSTVEYDLGFFHFNIMNQRLQLRRDKFANADLVSGWRYRSEPGPRIPPVEAVLDETGDLIRRTTTDGVVTEPMDFDRLREIHKGDQTKR